MRGPTVFEQGSAWRTEESRSEIGSTNDDPDVSRADRRSNVPLYRRGLAKVRGRLLTLLYLRVGTVWSRGKGAVGRMACPLADIIVTAHHSGR